MDVEASNPHGHQIDSRYDSAAASSPHYDTVLPTNLNREVHACVGASTPGIIVSPPLEDIEMIDTRTLGPSDVAVGESQLQETRSQYTIISSHDSHDLNNNLDDQGAQSDQHEFTWRPTEWWMEFCRRKERYRRGSKGARKLRKELPVTSREDRMRAFVAGRPTDNTDYFYLEDFQEAEHIDPQNVSKMPYLPRGQMKLKGHQSWLDKMETLGDYAKHSRYYLPAPSKLSQEITLTQDGQLQAVEARDYLGVLRQSTLYPKGSWCIGSAEDCYAYTCGPFYTSQLATIGAVTQTSNVAPTAVNNDTNETAVDNQDALEDSPPLQYLRSLIANNVDHPTSPEPMSPEASDNGLQEEYAPFSPPTARPSVPSPNKARYYYEQFEEAVYTDSEDSASERDVSDGDLDSLRQSPLIISPPRCVLGRAQSMPDLRYNEIKDIFTPGRFRAVSYEGVGAVPKTISAPTAGVVGPASGHRRASTPFQDIADDEYEYGISACPDSSTVSECDDSAELESDLQLSNSIDMYSPATDLVDAMMRAAYAQATAEAALSSSDYSNDQGPPKSPSLCSLLSDLSELQASELDTDAVALEYIQSCCSSPFKNASQDSLVKHIPAYQQQRSRSSTLESSTRCSSGEIAQLVSTKGDWPFECYDDDLESVADVDSSLDLIELAGPARSVHYGPMYPILSFRRQLSLCATWTSDADMLMHTAKLSAERQAQAMVEKAFEQPTEYQVRLKADCVIDFAYEATNPKKTTNKNLNKPLPPLPPSTERVKPSCKGVVAHFARSIVNGARKQMHRAIGLGKKKAYFIPH